MNFRPGNSCLQVVGPAFFYTDVMFGQAAEAVVRHRRRTISPKISAEFASSACKVE